MAGNQSGGKCFCHANLNQFGRLEHVVCGHQQRQRLQLYQHLSQQFIPILPADSSINRKGVKKLPPFPLPTRPASIPATGSFHVAGTTSVAAGRTDACGFSPAQAEAWTPTTV